MPPGPALMGAAPGPDLARPLRHAGEDARARLLRSGLRLFAQQYYFGDKAGLYRAVFFEPLGSPADDLALIDAPGLDLAQALAGLFAVFLEPLKQGDTARLCMKLRYREMLEPTGLWQEELTHDIKPLHEALVAALCRHFGLAQADDELRRLAICIVALGVHLHVGHDVVREVAPRLQDAPGDEWSARLVLYAQAMIEAEARRRAGAGGATA